MSVTLHLPDGGMRYLKHARTGESRQERDRRLYRPPFSPTWRTTGSGRKRPEEVRVTAEIWAASDYAVLTYDGEAVTIDGERIVAQTGLTQSTLTDVSPLLDTILTDAQNASRVDTPLGRWAIASFQSGVPVPIRGGGYRLDLVWIARGRVKTLTTLDGRTLTTLDGRPLVATTR